MCIGAWVGGFLLMEVDRHCRLTVNSLTLTNLWYLLYIDRSIFNRYFRTTHIVDFTIISVTNLEKKVLWAWRAPKVRSSNSGIWGHPPGRLKSHIKSGACCAFWRLYFDKFTVPHVIFRNYACSEITKKGVCPKIREILRYHPWAMSLWAMPNKICEGHGDYAGADPEGGFGGFEPPPWSSKSFTSTVKLPSPNVSHSGGALWECPLRRPWTPPFKKSWIRACYVRVGITVLCFCPYSCRTSLALEVICSTLSRTTAPSTAWEPTGGLSLGYSSSLERPCSSPDSVISR